MSEFTAENKAMRALLFTGILYTLLSACGQKGDLYIPQPGYTGKLALAETKVDK